MGDDHCRTAIDWSNNFYSEEVEVGSGRDAPDIYLATVMHSDRPQVSIKAKRMLKVSDSHET